MIGQSWWEAAQWAAYLEHQEQPIKASSKAALRVLEEHAGEGRRSDTLSGQAYAALMLDDPMLALRLIREANKRLPRRMARDITTPLGVMLALGTVAFREQIDTAPEISEENTGFMTCEARTSLAARIAYAWGALHYDLDSGELAMAALLANAGEVELWAFVPELPQKALDELHSGRATRSEAAQRQACGFAFLDVTLLLIDAWNLPQLIKQLIRGDEGLRARLARLAVNTARHLSNGASDPALPDDLREAAKLTGTTLSVVISALPDISAEEKAVLLEATEAAE
ncbi:MAG: HDOD domain-containing protein [Pseudomonadota bacterium]|nr:HDOD domain-containing protein [Pseudomonadota bacterium]